jgi:coenzyme F420-reducing hydrogenase beta subunit
MINILEKTNCCGCSACIQRCPKQCISLHEDEEGFLYPKVNLDICIDCRLCEKFCPVLHQTEKRIPLDVFAARNPDKQIRMESSSGGVFTQLAEQTIDTGGVVFGVKWNKHFEAVHAYTETKEGLVAFRGSKYIQSQIGDTFKQAEQFLKQGRQVLYSGTPCQIAALKLFLSKDYYNLLAVDFICHGVPSPGVFRWYLSEELAQEAARQSEKKNQLCSSYPFSSIAKVDILAREQGFEVEDIRFRDKRVGWKKYSFVLSLKSLYKGTNTDENSVSLSYTVDKSDFMRGFLSDLYLRPSYHACPAKSGKSGADITLGDYWGIESLIPQLDDDRGVSALIINTEKGKKVLHATTAELYPVPYNDLRVKNPALEHSCRISPNRILFFADSRETFHHRIKRLCRIPLERKIKKKVISLINQVLSKKHKLLNQFLGNNI